MLRLRDMRTGVAEVVAQPNPNDASAMPDIAHTRPDRWPCAETDRNDETGRTRKVQPVSGYLFVIHFGDRLSS
jgi:hypothetical protein